MARALVDGVQVLFDGCAGRLRNEEHFVPAQIVFDQGTVGDDPAFFVHPFQESRGNAFRRFEVRFDQIGQMAVLDHLNQFARVVGRKQLGQLNRDVHRGHKLTNGVDRRVA